MKFVSHSPSETEAFARNYVGGLLDARLKSKAKSKSKAQNAFILGLYGNLGSGKTAFTQTIAAAFGVRDPVTSPTFVIEKIYPLTNSLSTVDSQNVSSPLFIPGSQQFSSHDLEIFTHLIHIDAYRLENSDEMRHLGWDEIAANPGNLIIVEWPERIADLLPPDHARLIFTFVDETTREIEVVQ